MIIIDTPFHITFSSRNDAPKWACLLKCKKVWWDLDFEGYPMGLCPMCQSATTSATEGVHFKILSNEDRNLTLADLLKYESGTPSPNIFKLGDLLTKGAFVNHSSTVKDAFISRAITQWNASCVGTATVQTAEFFTSLLDKP
jgi:hypothetical protein